MVLWVHFRVAMLLLVWGQRQIKESKRLLQHEEQKTNPEVRLDVSSLLRQSPGSTDQFYDCWRENWPDYAVCDFFLQQNIHTTGSCDNPLASCPRWCKILFLSLKPHEIVQKANICCITEWFYTSFKIKYFMKQWQFQKPFNRVLAPPGSGPNELHPELKSVPCCHGAALEQFSSHRCFNIVFFPSCWAAEACDWKPFSVRTHSNIWSTYFCWQKQFILASRIRFELASWKQQNKSKEKSVNLHNDCVLKKKKN